MFMRTTYQFSEPGDARLLDYIASSAAAFPDQYKEKLGKFFVYKGIMREDDPDFADDMHYIAKRSQIKKTPGNDQNTALLVVDELPDNYTWTPRFMGNFYAHCALYGLRKKAAPFIQGEPKVVYDNMDMLRTMGQILAVHREVLQDPDIAPDPEFFRETLNVPKLI